MGLKSIEFNEATLWLEAGIHLPTRTLYWGNPTLDSGEESEINSDFAAKAIKSLHYLDNISSGDINIFLNGSGGDVIYALGIYDYIKKCKNTVSISVFGPAFSATSIILQAGSKRYMSRHSRLLLHYGSISINQEPSKSAKAWSKAMDIVDDEVEDIYYSKILQKNPEFKKKDLQDMMKVDSILSSTEAISLGLVDEII